MLTPSNQRLIVIGLYVNAVLLAAGLVTLLSRSSMPSFLPAAYAQGQGAIAGGAGVFIVPAQFNTNTYGCYLLDIDAQTICAYQFVPNGTKLQFMAARHFRYDRQLKNYNSETPSWSEVKDLVEREMQANRVQEQNNQRPPVERPQ